MCDGAVAHMFTQALILSGIICQMPTCYTCPISTWDHRLHAEVAAVDVTATCMQAVKQMETFISLLQSMHSCKATDPRMELAWEAKASVHKRCGDSANAQYCHRQALKCKSTLAKSKGRPVR